MEGGRLPLRHPGGAVCFVVIPALSGRTSFLTATSAPSAHRKTMSLRCGNDVSLLAVYILGSRVRESIADLPEQIVRSKCHPAGTWQMSTGHLHLDWFDSRPSSRYKKSTPSGVLFLYGAGYGNRTRLCGLGSDRSTDELTLRCGVIITDPGQKINPFLSNRSRLTVPEWTWRT